MATYTIHTAKANLSKLIARGRKPVARLATSVSASVDGEIMGWERATPVARSWQ
jgi:hypothetical protein